MRGCLCGHWSYLSSSCRLLLHLPLCQNKQAQLSQSLLRGQMMSILKAFYWTLLSSSLTFIKSRASAWAQLSRQSLQCRTSLDLLAVPSSEWPSIGLPASQGGCTMAHIHTGTRRGPCYFQQGWAVSQSSTFQLCLCVRLFFPKCRILQVCLLNFGKFLLL